MHLEVDSGSVKFIMADIQDEEDQVLSISELISTCVASYSRKTTKREKLCDCYILFCVILLSTSIIYKMIVPREPFAPFASCLFASLGSMTFAVNLRLKSRDTSGSVLVEFVLCNLLLFFLGVINLN